MGLVAGRGDGADGVVYLGGPKEVDDFEADGAVTPGAVVVSGSSGGQIAEASSQTAAIVGVVQDNAWQQRDATSSTDFAWLDDFSDGERVPVNVAVGQEFMGILASASDDVSTGDKLVTAADGELTKYDSESHEDDKAVFAYIGHSDGSGGNRVPVKYTG